VFSLSSRVSSAVELRFCNLVLAVSACLSLSRIVLFHWLFCRSSTLPMRARNGLPTPARWQFRWHFLPCKFDYLFANGGSALLTSGSGT
jgi:hypothetical protein